jgi:hypothetical protein
LSGRWVGLDLAAVMAGLGPAIHDFAVAPAKSWMLGPIPRMTIGREDTLSALSRFCC